ncbi:hypothetical protein [Treponema pedis]|uniref:hypothetical protein n=1 Tax=Treponema pedis TaxID=409322 RepID=UPI001AF29404|nr:hypothetical protein [Treponema pedis]QSI03486.1 hypothetical protein DYQ05_00425 [Treponema pedis]
MKTRCLLKKSNYLFWTAIEAVHAVRQSRTSSPILFAVCLSKKQALTGGKVLPMKTSAAKRLERYWCSKPIGAASKQARCHIKNRTSLYSF